MKAEQQNKFIEIKGTKIGSKFPPYIVAELSANHNGNLEQAKELIKQAKICGANAVKLQTYKPDTITLKSEENDFMIDQGPWAGRSLYDLYEEAHTPWEWHSPLFKYAEKLGITIFSSPFDSTAVDLLEDLSAPAYKIASFEAVDLPLIKHVASTNKPMIISTGMANKTEIGEALEAAKEGGCTQIALLHCVSSYPAPVDEYNLLTLQDMIKKFGVVTGLSDHTTDNIASISAVSFGASIIEKHFTLDKSAGGPDDFFSLEPKDLKHLCENTLSAWKAVGKIDYGLKSSERGNIKFRRSLYFVKEMKKGDIISVDSVRSVRPGYGIKPSFIEKIIGKRLNCSVKKHTPVKINQIEVD